jgi:hypothetical protein
LVPHSWAEVPVGADPYPAGSRWADPDIEAAASMMRSVVKDQKGAAERAERGRADVEREFGAAKRAEVLRERFDAAETRRIDRPGRLTGSPRRRTAIATTRQVARGLGAVERRVRSLEKKLRGDIEDR